MRYAKYFAAALVLVPTSSWSDPSSILPSATTGPRDGEFSIQTGTQGNFGELHVGVGYTIIGPYIDENGVHRYGQYASLEIAIQGAPALFRQPDVHEGQTVEVGRYRILIERIIPGDRGTVVLRILSIDRDSSSESNPRFTSKKICEMIR